MRLLVVNSLFCIRQSFAHAIEGKCRRRDGNEHADEGLGEGSRGTLCSLPLPPSGVVVWKYVGCLGADDMKVHRQEALRRKLVAGSRQISVL